MANKNTRASRFAAPIGGVFIILCVIGLVSLISYCFSFTQGLLDNSNAKHDYENMLLPVVMFDPPPFENPTSMRQVDLLMYSVWSTALGSKRDVYEYDDNMSLVIPASDVDMAAFQLFGPEVVLSHSTFGDYEIVYLYDPTTKSYHVPVSALTGFYTPRVEEIVKKNDIIQLKVGYVPPANAMNIDLSGKGVDERKPDKYMIYELRKGKNSEYLYAIRDVEGAGYMTGSDANPLVNDLFDDYNDPDKVAEEPADQMQFMIPDSSESAVEGDSPSGEGSSGSSSEGEEPAENGSSGEEPPPEDGESSSESISAPEVQG